MAVTLQDIANRLNVSKMTVSRVLSNRNSGAVTEKTRNLILETAHKMGYVPNYAARSLATGRTYTIGLWLPAFNPYYTKIANCIERLVNAAGYEMVVSHLGMNANADLDSTPLPQIAVDGVILADRGLTIANKAFVSKRLEFVPCVSVGGILNKDMNDIDYVKIDIYTGMRRSVRHIIDIGCHRVALMGPKTANYDIGESRQSAYLDEIKDSDLIPEFITDEDSSLKSGVESVKKYISENGRPDGICCFTDVAAISCCKALRDMDIQVPEDVAVMGFDGTEEAEYFNPTLSTVEQPIEEMCDCAWQFLQNRIAEPALPVQQKILEPLLVVRESTGH